MRELRTPLPLLFAVAVTRGMLGVGVGLLLSKRLARRRRTQVGMALAAIGAATTIPLAIGLFRTQRKGLNGHTIANVPQSGADPRSEEMLAH
jgi:hypothetical protein